MRYLLEKIDNDHWYINEIIDIFESDRFTECGWIVNRHKVKLNLNDPPDKFSRDLNKAMKEIRNKQINQTGVI